VHGKSEKLTNVSRQNFRQTAYPLQMHSLFKICSKNSEGYSDSP